MISDEYYINEYVETRGLSQKTKYDLQTVLKHYTKFNKLTLHELLEEADTEEENGIRWKKRTLRLRLLSYANQLKKEMTINSAKQYLHVIKSFYRHHYIEIGLLPKINEKNAIKYTPIQPKDLPTHEIIKNAVEIAEPVMKAIILFLSSSGLSKIDTLNLTIKDFIEATFSYHQQTDHSKALEKLWEIYNTMDIIPIFKARRQKTGKFFITFCTPEATNEILNYLKIRNERKQLKPNDKLFKIDKNYYTRKFGEINDALDLGTVGDASDERKGYNRLRGHMLRKFHASNLERAGMNRYLINVLQGKSNNSVDDVYFFEDEDMLLQEYLNAMDGLLIFTEVKEINKYSPEYQLLEKENDELKEKYNQLRVDVDEIKTWYKV